MAAQDVPEPAVTRLLDDAREGRPHAAEQLLERLYGELHAIAQRHMRGERSYHTLQPTALVSEAVLRLLGRDSFAFEGRAHFLRSASQAMRRVLVDHARARNAAKRDGGVRVTLQDDLDGAPERAVDVLELDEALTRLAVAEPRWAQVVELRYLLGLEVTEVAEVLGTSPATVKRDWQFARAWLARELAPDAEA